MRFGFDIEYFVGNQLPYHKRQPNRLKLFMWPLIEVRRMFVAFNVWLLEMVYQSNITGQKMALENLLNREVANSNNQIYIDEIISNGVWLSLAVENSDYVWLSTESEGMSFQYFGLSTEEEQDALNANFKVFVPAGVEHGEVDKYVMRYVIAGMRYKIVNI
jgi:hypothetical protein